MKGVAMMIVRTRFASAVSLAISLSANAIFDLRLFFPPPISDSQRSQSTRKAQQAATVDRCSP